MVHTLRSSEACSVVTSSHTPFDLVNRSILHDGISGEVRVKQPPCLVLHPMVVFLLHRCMVYSGKELSTSSSLCPGVSKLSVTTMMWFVLESGFTMVSLINLDLLLHSSTIPLVLKRENFTSVTGVG